MRSLSLVLFLFAVVVPAFGAPPGDEILALVTGETRVTELNVVNVKSGTATPLVQFPGQLPQSSDAHTFVVGGKGTVYVALEDEQTRKPVLNTVHLSKKPYHSSRVTLSPEVCPLWQLQRHPTTGVLYGISIESKTNGTLFSINPKDGKTTKVGAFPLIVQKTAPARQEVQSTMEASVTCYTMLGGGAMIDGDKNEIWLHFSDGAKGTYVESVSLHNADVTFNGFIPGDLAAPVWASGQDKKVVSLTYESTPPYAKHLSVYSLASGKTENRGPVIPYFSFYGNLAAIDTHSQLYTCIMAPKSNSTTKFHIVTIDVPSGEVVAAPPVPEVIFWQLMGYGQQ